MRAGALKHTIDIQKRVSNRNGVGEDLATWESYHKTAASIQAPRGREYFAALQINSETTTQVQIRQCCGKRFDTKMRIVVNGDRYLDIKSVLPDWNKGREVVFMCAETNEYQH